MQRIARLYVSRFGSPTAWYENLLFDLTDPDTQEPTDTIFNLENAGGKTSLLSYVFSCFEPRQERWLQHLQKKNHRFAEYFMRDGRPSFIAMEWNMPSRQVSLFEDCKLVIGQAVTLRESAERGSDIERWFFAFEATEDFGLENLPVAGLSAAPVSTMQEFVQWMHQAGKQAGDFFYTKIQDDWIKHLGNARLLDIELLRMQVDFNSNEGGMEEGFLTFNSESDLLRRFLLLTLDPEKSLAVRDAVARTADKLKSKPKFEGRLEQLTRLQSVMVPFLEAAAIYEVSDQEQKQTQQQAAGLAAALTVRSRELRQTALEKADHAKVQEEIAKASADHAKLHQAEVIAIQGLQLDRKVAAAKNAYEKAKQAYEDGKHLQRCIEGAKALVHVEAAKARQEDLEARMESERDQLRPALEHAKTQGAMLSHALQAAEKLALERKREAEDIEADAGALMETIDGQKNEIETAVRALSTEKGQLEAFQANHRRQRERLIEERLLEPGDAESGTALARWERQVHEQQAKLESLNDERSRQEELERNSRKQAGDAEIEAHKAKIAQAPHRQFLADGYALRDKLRQLAALRLVADAEEADPDSPILPDLLARLLTETQRDITDCNIRLAQFKADRESIIETGLAGRSADIDAVVRQLQSSGIRSARAANTYLAELCPEAETARALVMSDPARFLGVNVAEGEWAKTRQLVPTLKFRLSVPVTVAVASVEASQVHPDRLVLAPQDDSAYHKASAQQALAALDVHIAEVEKQRDAYQERRDSAAAADASLRRYQTEFGAARLRLTEAELERLEADEQAALNRQQALIERADQALNLAKALAAESALLPGKIEKLKNDLLRIKDFQNDWEMPLPAKLARLAAIQELLEERQAQAENLKSQRIEAEKRQRHAVEDRLRHEGEAKKLADQRAEIAYCDAAYPAEDRLRLHPCDMEALRKSYADAVSILETQERDRLGVLAEKLKNAREEHQNAKKIYDADFSDLSRAELEPLRSLDFESALRDQKIAVTRLGEADRDADRTLANATAEASAFWKGQKQRFPATPAMERQSDVELVSAIEALQNQISQREAMAEKAGHEAARLRKEGAQAESDAKKFDMLLGALKASVPYDAFDAGPMPMALPEKVDAFAHELMAKFRRQNEQLDKLRGKAQDAFRLLTKTAASRELAEVEPELAHDIADSEFGPACADRARIAALIEDRICATRDTLDGMTPDFENCVGELYNLTAEGMGILRRACEKTMPIGTPYVGGKPILKTKASFAGISVEVRKNAIRHYLNALIDSNVIPAKGSDLAAQCLVAMSGRQELGLQVLKMEQNEAYQYQLAGELKGSKGQGSVIAMFLYLLISQLRADTQARVKRGGGGPLILDNPFAKVQTRALIDAQRLLAREIGVQLIFFTANADYNILAGFKRIIRLRKSGVNNKTERSHIEMVSAVFEELAYED